LSETAESNPAVASARKSIAYYPEENCRINLAGRYDYLELPYYLSQDLESSGQKVYPSCADALDAYITPVFLEKARLAGLKVPEYYITNGYFEPPVIVYPINPFMQKFSVVLKAGHKGRVAKSITRNYTYAVCCQDIPPGAKIRHFRSVLGWSVNKQYRDLSERMWEVYRIPLAEVRVMVLESGETLLSDLVQLPFESLNVRELAYLNERVRWGD
jgi:hypothetical protein